MFARFSAAILLALPLLAVADSCSTGTQHCCNQAQDAKSANAVDILGTIVGAGVPGLIGQAGLTCSPITGIGASGTSCNSQVVCCSNNNFNGVVALGCTPINVNA
ncbi:hypothetical protein DXG01_014595 [Tephrocybe rancida]|nr:hypothetical protein DXG01_014595 [Tephrocybe rancida]